MSNYPHFKSLMSTLYKKPKEIIKVFNKPDFFNVLQTAKNEEQILKAIEEKKLLDNISSNDLNYKKINENVSNTLLYCLYHRYFKLAAIIINIDGVEVDIQIGHESPLNRMVNMIHLQNDTKPLFDALFSKTRKHENTENNNIFHNLYTVLLDAPTDLYVKRFLKAFSIDPTQKDYQGSDLLDFMSEREDLPYFSLKAVLDTNKFSKERLEEFLSSEKNISEIDGFRQLVQDKLIEMIKLSRDDLDSKLNQTVDKAKVKNKI
jgi:hypothetical protein